MIIVLSTRDGARFYLGANGMTKQRARALNVFSKTVEARIEAIKSSEWYTLNGKGGKFSTEPSPAGALGRPRKVAKRGRGRPKAKRGPGRPKGSKNKTSDEAPAKRRGRPPGSKNKPKVAEAAEAPAAAVEPAAQVAATA